MVHNNGNGMRHSLNVLPPFSESENGCEEFSIVNIIVMFSREEGTREVSTGVKVTIGISLE